MKKILLICGMIGLMPQAMAWSIFSPSNYDDCVLANIKDAQTPQAVIAVKQSCKEKFKPKPPKEIELPSQVIQSLDGRADMNYDFNSQWNGYFVGQIFNKNNEWTITSVVIRIANNKTNQFNDYFTKLDSSESEIGIHPLTIGTFGFRPFEVPEDRSWSIIKSYGYKIY
jgi:hypothetical protein